MTEEELDQIGNAATDVAVECMAQMTRFVVRGQKTAEEAATIAWQMGEAFAVETARKLVKNEGEH